MPTSPAWTALLVASLAESSLHAQAAGAPAGNTAAPPAPTTVTQTVVIDPPPTTVSGTGRKGTPGGPTEAPPFTTPSARLIMPEKPVKPGVPFGATIELKIIGNTNDLYRNLPKIALENGAKLEYLGARAETKVHNRTFYCTHAIVMGSEAPTKPGTYKIPATTYTYQSTVYAIPEGTLVVRELAPGESLYEKADCTLEVSDAPVFPGDNIPMKLIVTDSDDERFVNLSRIRVENDEALSIELQPHRNNLNTEVLVNGKKRRRTEIPLNAGTLIADDLPLAILANLVFDTGTGRTLPRLFRLPFRIHSAHAPEAGKPASYQGAIGHFTVTPPALSVKTGKAGEPLRLAFTVTGTKGLERAAGPALASPDWAAHAEKPVLEKKAAGASTKTFAYTLTPRFGGALRTPPAEFSWFDPTDMKYHTAAVGDLDITVEGPPRPEVKQVETVKIPVLAADPAPTGVVRTHATIFGTRAYLGAQLAALVALAAAIGLVARRRRASADPVKAKRIHDLRLLRRRRRAARRALAAGDHGAYAARAREALRAAAALDTTAEADALTGKETLAALPADATTLAALATLFTHEESSLYAGAPRSAESLKGTSSALFDTLAKAENRKR